MCAKTVNKTFRHSPVYRRNSVFTHLQNRIFNEGKLRSTKTLATL